MELTRLGLTLSARAEREEHFNAAERAAVLAVGSEVDQALAAQIRELPAAVDPALKREAWHARQPLADHLAALRPTPERRWAREAEAERDAGRRPAGQALEYARAAGRRRGARHADDRPGPGGRDQGGGLARAVRTGTGGARPSADARTGAARAIIDETGGGSRGLFTKLETPRRSALPIQARATLYHAG